MKTSELTGLSLNIAVAVALGHTVEKRWSKHPDGTRKTPYWMEKYASFDRQLQNYVDSSAGDDVIDCYRIGTEWVWSIEEPCWQAFIAQHSVARFRTEDGTTRREAAMRCFVAFKLGNNVEIP
jgi:hypothetical protein